MSLNKSAARLCACNAFRTPSSSMTSSHTSRPIFASPPQPQSQSHYESSSPAGRPRYYATVNSGSREQALPEWPKTANPTPYQILAMSKDAPYTKRRFYQLVKIYHPDKHDHDADSSVNHLPHAVRTERYRLIVAAHDLLSDPGKRRLYDAHGVGWSAAGGRTPDARETMRQTDQTWRHQPGSAARNATWEDWERWYAARDGKPADPMYMSNGVFATIVVAMCMVGAFAQMSRAEQSGAEYLEMRDQTNRAIGQHMARTTLMAAGRSKDERVDTFLRERENLSYAFEPGRWDNAEDDDHDASPLARARPRP